MPSRHAGERTDSSHVPADRNDVFASGAYWREYYASLGHENREVGEFLLETARSLSAGRLKILDAGCGPTLLYWAVFVPGDNEIHGFDISASNIRDNKKRMDDVRRGLFDPGLVEAAHYAIQSMSANTTPEDHLVAKVGQVASLSVADLSGRWVRIEPVRFRAIVFLRWRLCRTGRRSTRPCVRYGGSCARA